VLKWVLGILIVLVVVGGGGAALVVSTGALDQLQQGFHREPSAIEVEVQSVSVGDLVRTVNAPGTIEPELSVEVGAQVSARIIALPVEELDTVEEGEVLVRLDSEDVLARLEAAQSRLEAEQARLTGVQASLRLAEIDLGRQKELFEAGDVPKSVYDAAVASHEQAKSSLEVTKMSIKALSAEITERRKDLENTVIEASMSGVVTRVNSELGEMVLGTSQNIGTVIMEVADLDRMLMRARVDESNVSLVKEGQPATVYVLAYGERPFRGTVQRVRLLREIFRDGTAYVEAEILIDNPEKERLGIGWNANADIEVQTQYDVVKIPSQAVLDKRIEELPSEVLAAAPYIDRKKTFTRAVFKYVDGKAVITPVTIGSSDLTHTVILAGLNKDDEVITGPFRTLMELSQDSAVKRKGSDVPVAGADAPAEGDASSDEGTTEEGATEGATDEGAGGDEAVEGVDGQDANAAGAG
jgi:HlyD family secretion protein